MPTLYSTFSSLFPRLRAFVVVALALLLVTMGTPQSRTAMVVSQSENGTMRIYETEVHHASPSVMARSLIKLGRKPFERLLGEPRPLYMVHVGVPATPDHTPRNPRAPPNSPRAPPLLVS